VLIAILLLLLLMMMMMIMMMMMMTVTLDSSTTTFVIIVSWLAMQVPGSVQRQSLRNSQASVCEESVRRKTSNLHRGPRELQSQFLLFWYVMHMRETIGVKLTVNRQTVGNNGDFALSRAGARHCTSSLSLITMYAGNHHQRRR